FNFLDHYAKAVDRIHVLLIFEGSCLSAAGVELTEDTTSTRAQMKQLWRYRGKVDWNSWYPGVTPHLFKVEGILRDHSLSLVEDSLPL
ncbi:unnamed protein product, partial [Effrenium voratum]